jgi:hypothetical protein
MEKIKLTEKHLTEIVKKVITEEQKKKLFTPKNIDERKKDYQKIIEKRLEDLKNTPFGKLSKDHIFEWIHENNIDQELFSLRGMVLGDVYGTSFNKSTGDVTLFIDDNTDKNIAIKFKISDIQIGTYDPGPDGSDEIFYPLNN